MAIHGNVIIGCSLSYGQAVARPASGDLYCASIGPGDSCDIAAWYSWQAIHTTHYVDTELCSIVRPLKSTMSTLTRTYAMLDLDLLTCCRACLAVYKPYKPCSVLAVDATFLYALAKTAVPEIDLPSFQHNSARAGALENSKCDQKELIVAFAPNAS